MTGPRIGSLFAGYGGLEMGVASVLGGEPAWFSEIEPAPTRILAHHWPDVPNLGDITAVDWDTVEPIDVLTGGFPCQDVSHAGKRLGLKPGTRTGLWSHMAYAIDKLRPNLVVAENVRGLLSAEAGGDLEPCPWCVGNGERGALRALGAVLGDLADLRYDAQWVGVRASDAGAPHGRFRVFVFAWPATDTDRVGLGQPAFAPAGGRTLSGTLAGGEVVGARSPGGGVATDPGSLRGGPRRVAAPGQAAGRWSCGELAGRHGAPPTDTSGQRHGSLLHPGHLGPVDGDHASEARERERAREVPRDRSAETPPDADSIRRDGVTELHAPPAAGLNSEDRGHTHGRRDSGNGSAGAGTAWGDYEPAIRRWEHLTRPAPAPTEQNWAAWRKARRKRFASRAPIGHRGTLAPFTQPPGARLSPAFVEWMMGLPAGHVTSVPGLTRNDQLKALGNGVVPQQAALATRMWAATMQDAHPTIRSHDELPVMPTPRAGANRSSRRAMVDERQWAAPSLEQAVEIAQRVLPREFQTRDEVPGRSGRRGPTGTDGGLW